ncbi:alkyl/aryl-sulfatase [Desulfitobacterium chlororespirans]|uniref:Metallo-beta-lactamase superfamily protein n=1 Tax=Desulfitobacterium chlororespirans DSM 11544 TaxID=1121395 RepID=A0A1M7SLD0_9FIRM|nr:alkyl/aryl-sulfatase [Desulfitobacterium chlororespirans]SHN59293.1 Metallo-beta-lactamase superfamily protein [Desulfitobacterium chlororespirans DSM 11544]
MSRYLGEQKLIEEAQTGFPKGITKITDQVYFVLGYGSSTATLIEGQESCVLIDTLNGHEAAEEALAELRQFTDKPIKTIIFTHYHHFDHTAGAGVFAAEGCEIIARTPAYPQYTRSELLKDIAAIRGARQFGVGLTPEEIISMGIGPMNELNGTQAILKPTRWFSEDCLTLNLDGIEVHLVGAPGETDDQLFVWLPQFKVLCSGDNYYHSWPNLYAIRGGQYRDISQWVSSLNAMLAYDAEHLLPGHTKAISGKEAVQENLTNYRDAIQYILEETLKGMNKGMTIAQLVDTVQLPEKWAALPNLQEYYGTVEWTVRSIYTGYLGWFDGNPTKLGALPVGIKAEKTLTIMGGAEKVYAEAKQAIEHEDEQWGVELCDILLDAGEKVAESKALKAEGLLHLGRMQISANARHYYLACAKELLGKGGQAKLAGAAIDMDKKNEG